MKTRFTILLVTGMLASGALYAQECQVLLPAISGSYEGDCKKGKAEGQGTARGNDQYTGQFKGGYPEGQGTYTWKDGSIYEGMWARGKREGEGKMTIKRDGKPDSILAGFWKKDQYAGKFSKPFVVHNRTNQIARLDVRRIKGQGNSIQIELSSTSSTVPKLSGGITPKPEISEILLEEGNYGRIQHVSSTAKGSIKRLVDVRFPFRARIRMGTQEVDLEIREEGSWSTIIGLNE